jgi:hypothetical protein
MQHAYVYQDITAIVVNVRWFHRRAKITELPNVMAHVLVLRNTLGSTAIIRYALLIV